MALKFNNKRVTITINDEEIKLHYRRPTNKDTAEIEKTLKNLEKKEKQSSKNQKKAKALKAKQAKAEDAMFEIEADIDIKAALEDKKLSYHDNSKYQSLVKELKTINTLIEKLEETKDDNMYDLFFRAHLEKIIPNKEEFEKLDGIAKEYRGVYLVIIKEIQKAAAKQSEERGND